MLASSLLVATSLLVGQAELPSDHLGFLEPLVGQWVCDGVLQNEAPGIGSKGTEFLATISYTWAINKNALRICWSGKAADKETVQFIELIGWDNEQNKVVSQGFGTMGAVEHNVWTKTGNVIVCTTKQVDAKGQSVKLKYLHEIDGDVLTVRITEITADGEKQPDETYKYRQVR